MKTHLLIIIVNLLLMSSCKQKEISNIEIDQKNSTTQSGSEVDHPGSTAFKAQSIVNDSLVNQLESDLQEIILRSKFTIEKDPIENRHMDNLVDTIITRTFKNSEIETYQTGGDEMIIQARITDPDFKFMKTISVGSPKASLEKEIGTTITSTQLRIEDFTQNIAFLFKIENDKIEEIIYEGYVD